MKKKTVMNIKKVNYKIENIFKNIEGVNYCNPSKTYISDFTKKRDENFVYMNSINFKRFQNNNVFSISYNFVNLNRNEKENIFNLLQKKFKNKYTLVINYKKKIIYFIENEYFPKFISLFHITYHKKRMTYNYIPTEILKQIRNIVPNHNPFLIFDIFQEN